MSALYWIWAGLAALGIILNILLIGKPREPITHGIAVWILIMGSVSIFLYVSAALNL